MQMTLNESLQWVLDLSANDTLGEDIDNEGLTRPGLCGGSILSDTRASAKPGAGHIRQMSLN